MKKRILSIMGVAAGVVVLALVGCNKNNGYTAPNYPPPSNGGGGGGPAPNTVVIAGFAFSPTPLTVTHGTTVTWQNSDAATHDVAADNAAWNLGSQAGGTSKTMLFNTAGTFTYHCTIHPTMTGSIIVQ